MLLARHVWGAKLLAWQQMAGFLLRAQQENARDVRKKDKLENTYQKLVVGLCRAGC
jgi:hypothetical protein